MSANDRKVDLRNLFLSRQKELEVKLDGIRKNSTHAGTTGDASESGWIELLVDFLPGRDAVEKAIVIDSLGNTSHAIDIVIYDRQYSPLVFRSSGMVYVPAESVYAIIEAKQDLSKHHVEYASDKAASVRGLSRTTVGIPHAGGIYPPKPLFDIPGGIVTLSSGWSPALGDPLEDALRQSGSALDDRIQFGCVLESGSFLAKYDDRGGGFFLKKSDADLALMSFLFDLFQTLRDLGTVPAIDIGSYARWLDDDFRNLCVKEKS